MHPDLFDYQRKGALWLSTREYSILADEMGVGKTATSIAAADLSGAKSILILTPGIARINWVREIERWQTTPRTVSAVMTTKDRPTTDVVVCSYSLLRTLPILEHLLQRRWDVLIADEAQALKSNVSLVTRCVYGNTFDRKYGLIAQCDRVWLLSGTIMPNHPGELWPHCASLFPQICDGQSYQQWITRYCEINPRDQRITGRSKQWSDFIPRLVPYVLRRTQKAVYPDMPPLRFSQVVVHPDKLPPKSTEIAETEAIVNAAIGSADPEETQRLMASIDEMHLASLVKWTGVAKAHAVGEYLLEEFNNGLDKCVVFAHHREVFAVLESILPDFVSIHGGTSGVNRQRAIDGFQGKIPGYEPRGLIVQDNMGSTALTLTAGCHVEFAEQSWVPSVIQQAAKRCHRIGQTRPVLARLFSLQGSVDEKIGNVLVRKARQVNDFQTRITT